MAAIFPLCERIGVEEKCFAIEGARLHRRSRALHSHEIVTLARVPHWPLQTPPDMENADSEGRSLTATTL